MVFLTIGQNGTRDFGATLSGMESGKLRHFITDNARLLIFGVDDAFKRLLDFPDTTVTLLAAAYSDNT